MLILMIQKSNPPTRINDNFQDQGHHTISFCQTFFADITSDRNEYWKVSFVEECTSSGT